MKNFFTVQNLPKVNLGEVCSFKSGNSLPDGEEFLNQECGFLLLKVSDLNRDENIPIIKVASSWTQLQVLESTSCRAGAIIFPKRGGAIATNKKRILGRPAILDPNLMGVEPNKNIVDSLYLYYWFQQFDLTQITSGSAVPQLNKQDLFPLKIPLPPLEEQHRIAAILDKADAIRHKRFEAIRLTEELLRAAFLDMFGDPVTNPKGWEMFALEDLVFDIESGWSPKCDFQEAKIDEWGVLKLGAVTWGHFNDSENKALLPGTIPRPELEVKPGDLLFSRKNTYELVGASAFVHTTRPKLLLPDLIFRLCLKDTVNPVYVWQVLSQETMRTELSKLASGSAGSMPNISKARLRTLCLPVPPLEAQLKYYQIAKLFWKEQNHQKEFLQSSDKLFNSLLHRAFRGEL